MKLYHQIFIAYFVLIGLGGYYLLDLSVHHIKPAMRQSSEDLLVDISNLLAEMVEQEFVEIELDNSEFSRNISQFINRDIKAKIFDIRKSNSNLRIYITDHQGIVRFHSDPEKQNEVGKDYSQWNDVYLTLKGRYGARSTEDVKGKSFTTVMHVAAPIIYNDEIVGVLTVGKPGVDIQPYIDKSIESLRKQGIIILLLSISIGLIISVWLTRSIRSLTQYALGIKEGKTQQLPVIKDTELNVLANSINDMRIELEGKNYVEHYVHSLTHELKSPIAAISGAIELLSKDMDEETFQHFKNNISLEAERLNACVIHLLELVRIENTESIENKENVSIRSIFEELQQIKSPQLQSKSLTLNIDSDDSNVIGDRFLLKQCFDNLIQNAIDFSDNESEINVHIHAEPEKINIEILDQGAGIPDFATDKIFDRFYSLARPNDGRKSTGIGLSFVQQVIKLHEGDITITNRDPKGVAVNIHLAKNI